MPLHNKKQEMMSSHSIVTLTIHWQATHNVWLKHSTWAPHTLKRCKWTPYQIIFFLSAVSTI